MKRIVIPVGWFVLGGLAVLINDCLLFQFWAYLDWRKPVADWFVSMGHPLIAAYWSLVWVNLPEWVVAIFVGAIVGLMSPLRNRLWHSFVAGAGFIAIPHLAMLLSLGMHPWSYFPLEASVRAFCWDLAAVPLLVLAAWVSGRLRQKPAESGGPALPAVTQ